MAIKGVKTIAEYAIRKWMEEQNFAAEYFTLTMNGNTGTLTDRHGESLILTYDPSTKTVRPEEDQEHHPEQAIDRGFVELRKEMKDINREFVELRKEMEDINREAAELRELINTANETATNCHQKEGPRC